MTRTKYAFLLMLFISTNIYAQIQLPMPGGNFGTNINSINSQVSTPGAIEKNYDKFTNEVRFNTPILDNIELVKTFTLNSKDTTYYLFLRTNGLTLNVGTKGIIILFTDGTKISDNDADIDVDVADNTDDGYKYSGSITLTESEIKQLCSKDIEAFKLFIYEGVPPNNFKTNVNCLIKAQ